MRSFPKVVYKYRTWNDIADNGYDLNRLITHTEIYLSAPSTLNADYEECNIPYDFDGIDIGNLKAFALREIQKRHPLWNVEHHKKEAERVLRESRIFDQDFQQGDMQRYIKNLNDRYKGVFCTSYEINSLKVWEHLGNLGKGYAVGFNAMKLHEQINGSCGYVDYYPDGEPPKIIPFQLDKIESFKNELRSEFAVPKSYEDSEYEFRFVTHQYDPSANRNVPYTEESRLMEVESDTIVSLYLGYLMDKEDQDEILSIIGELDHNIKCFQIKVENGELRYNKL